MAREPAATNNLTGRDVELSAERRAELELADRIEAELRRPPLPRWPAKKIEWEE